MTAPPPIIDARDTAAEIERIRTLKARYFRFMDTKDWAALAGVFTEDARFDFREDGAPDVIEGVDAFLPFLRAGIESAITVHHGHMGEVEILSPSTARGIWALEDQLWWLEGGPLRSLHGFGHYHETYGKTAEGWKITSMRLTRLHRVTE